MRLPGAWLALLLTALAAPPVLEGQSRPRYPSVAQTRAEFEAVCDRILNGDGPFFGATVVSELQEKLAAEDLDPAKEIGYRMNLAIQLIRLGRLAEAVATVSVPMPEMDSSTRVSHLLLLAVARLQIAEEQNCVESQGAGACILPLRPEAVHRHPDETRRAGDHYLEYLRHNPYDLHIRWLLNLSRMLSGDYPDGVPEALRLPSEALSGPDDFARWDDIAPRLGVNPFDLSGGAVMDDFDGDGLLDLIATSWHPCDPMKAFRNDGEGGFEDVTAAWGLDGQLGGLNLNHADYDGDGRLDLFVMRGAWMGQAGRIRNSLLRNDLDREAGRFVDVSAGAGLAFPAYPTQASAWADYDGDGDLDLYIGNESTAANLMTYGATGESYPSQLFRNNGDGTFSDVARSAGVTNLRYAKGVGWGDYDEDDDPDLYVSNFGDNRLYRNLGDGTFEDVAPELGVTGPNKASFATWFFDWDNDGDLDIWVNDYSTPAHEVPAWYFGARRGEGQPLLHRNDAEGFTTLSTGIGLDKPLLPMGSNFGDLDNDGFEDVFLGTGVPDFDAIMPNVVFRNERGERFDDVTFAGGFGHLQKGHGVAFGDLDNDGDQDVYHQLGGAYPFDGFGNALFENPGSDHAWVTLRLRGLGANPFAMGARVEVRVDGPSGPASIHALAGSGGSFGGSSFQQEIGLGDAERIEAIVVRWPSGGGRQTFTGPFAARTVYEIRQGLPEVRELSLPRLTLTGTERAAHGHESR